MMGDSMASFPKLLVALAIFPSLLLVSQQREVEHAGEIAGRKFSTEQRMGDSSRRHAGGRGYVPHAIRSVAQRQISSGFERRLSSSISVIDVASRRELHRTRVPDAWLGLVFAPDGKTVYVGGDSKARVYHFNFDPQTGELSASGEFAAVNDLNSPGHSFIGDVAMSPDAHLLYAADILETRLRSLICNRDGS